MRSRRLPDHGRCFVLLLKLAVAALVSQPAMANAQGSTSQAKTGTAAHEVEGGAVIAFVNLDRSPMGTLLEARLRTKRLVNWWPRGLTSQLLDALAPGHQADLPAEAAADGEKRLPDAITLFRIEPRGTDRVARVIVCDPRLGLRLGAREVKLSATASEDLEQLAVNSATLLRKLGEPLTELWAIPPFRCHDLTSSQHYVRQALASDLEQILLARQGSFAVELEFPEALTLARRIAGITGPIERPLPRIALGEFRTEGEGDLQKVAVAISLRHGDTSRTAVKFAADFKDIHANLEVAATKLASQSVEDGLQRQDGAASGTAIARVIADYERTDDPQAILRLAEAGLLVNPDDQRFRQYALSMLSRIAQQHESKLRELGRAAPPPSILGPISYRNAPPMPALLAAETLQTLTDYHRGLAHGEIVVSQSTADVAVAFALRKEVSILVGSLADNVLRSDLPAPMVRLYHNLRLRRQDLVLKLTELAAARGEDRDLLLLTMHVLPELSVEERHALLLRMIVEWNHHPNSEARNLAYAQAVFPNGTLTPEQVDYFLKQLAALPIPDAQKIVARVQANRAAREARRVKTVAPQRDAPSNPPDPDAQVTFTPISIPWKDRRTEAATVCEFYLSLGEKGDLFGGHRQLVLTTKDGDSKLVWESEQDDVSFRGPGAMFVHRPAAACFDGRFAWVPLHVRGKSTRLVIVDAQRGTASEITSADGLPSEGLTESSEKHLMATALAPGKALIVGSFGKTWLGIATIDSDHKKSLKIIHEARDVLDLRDQSQWRTTTLAFQPSYLYSLSGKMDGTDIQRVLVGREVPNVNVRTHPLFVDPQTGNVDLLSEEIRLPPGAWFVERGGSLYWTIAWQRNQTYGVDLYRRSLPELKSELVAKLELAGQGLRSALAWEADRIHIVAEQWHIADTPSAKPRMLRGRLPITASEPRQIHLSSVHGWLLYAPRQSKIYAVKFKESP